jgi:hypothetical protein
VPAGILLNCAKLPSQTNTAHNTTYAGRHGETFEKRPYLPNLGDGLRFKSSYSLTLNKNERFSNISWVAILRHNQSIYYHVTGNPVNQA